MLLGQKVECIITGLKGILVCRADYLNGMTRWDVQPTIDKDGKIPDQPGIDENQLKIINKKRAVECLEPEHLVKLGQEILDPISDIKGIAIGSATFLSGCRRILLGPKKSKDGKIQKAVWIDDSQLKILNKKPKVKQSNKTTGGPGPMVVPNRDY